MFKSFKKFEKINKNNVTWLQALLLSLKKNRESEAPEHKKTTFLELFFDLAVVFVFALLASHFADYIGVSSEAFIGQGADFKVTHSEIGLLIWIMNFVFLWRVWSRYGILFRKHGNEGLLSHWLTIMLILCMAVQSLSIIVPTKFFFTYGLLITYASAKATAMVYETNIILLKIKHGTLDKKALKGVLIEFSVFIFFFCEFVTYIMLDKHGVIKETYINGTPDIWQFQLSIASIMLITLIIDITFSIILKGRSRELNEMQIYGHTKERHHLLVIIALGESVLFNVGEHIRNDSEVARMFPELVLNLLIVIMVWTAYKSYVYRVTYAHGGRNVTIFTMTHIFILLSMMLMFSSLEAYADAQSKYYDLLKLSDKIGGGVVQFAPLDDLKYSLYVTYPIIYLAGFVLFFISMIVMVFALKFGDDIYDEVIRNKKWWLAGKFVFIITILSLVIMAIALGFEIKLVWVFLGTFILLLGEFITGSLRTNKIMLSITGKMNKAIEELNQLEK